MQVPEFLADAAVRKSAGMGPLQSDGDRENIGRKAHQMNGFPSVPPVAGAPISDERPASMQSYPLMNGHTRAGVCDVCGDEGQLTFEVNLAIQNTIEKLQMQTCADCEARLAGNGRLLMRVLYKKGRFH